MKNTQKLLEIMAQLRHPETGCPWDLRQDFASLIPYTLEEAYEVADAAERGDILHLQEELGDLLLQVVFHSRIAEERQLFDFESVAEIISEKLIRRHPHVFGETVFENDEERHQFWEDSKQLEQQEKGRNQENTSVLDGIPPRFPALMTAQKLQNRAARHGFDWPDVEPVFEKVREELDELEEAYVKGDGANIREEIGDLLFVMVNLARHFSIDAEAALRNSNRKFTRRFQYIEERVADQGRQMNECHLEELDALWDEAKRRLPHDDASERSNGAYDVPTQD
jgi:MazG family protein